LRIKEEETCLTLQEHDDDDDDEFPSVNVGGFLYWGTRKMRFLRDMQNAL
jgi:hypothetical protein